MFNMGKGETRQKKNSCERASNEVYTVYQKCTSGLTQHQSLLPITPHASLLVLMFFLKEMASAGFYLPLTMTDASVSIGSYFY